MNSVRFVDILTADETLKEKVRQWRNREDIRRFMLTQHIINKNEHSDWLKALKDRSDMKFWVVYDKDTPIGSAYLQNIKHERLSSEWGFYIGDAAYRGKGIGKEVLFKLLEIFFEEMKFNVLFTKVLSGNSAALRLYNKFGFREIDKSSFKPGEEIILLKFSKEDWDEYNKR